MINNVMITGDLGFVGSETKKYLEEKNIVVHGYDIMRGQDIRDKRQLELFLTTWKPEVILHLAAVSRFADADKDPKLTVETNVIGTRNLAELAKKCHIPIVYSSTGSVYMPIVQEPPITEKFIAGGNSVYGCTKYMGELYIKECNPYIILRYAHLYGREKRGHGLVGGFVNRISRGLEPELYGGSQSNDFTYIKDIVVANDLAINASWDKWNQIYNIGTGEELTAESAGKILCDVMGYTGGVAIKEQRTVDPQRFVFDCSKAENILGFKARYNFQKGLEDMFEN